MHDLLTICIICRYNICLWANWNRQDLHYGGCSWCIRTQWHYSQFFCSHFWPYCQVWGWSEVSQNWSLLQILMCNCYSVDFLWECLTCKFIMKMFVICLAKLPLQNWRLLYYSVLCHAYTVSVVKCKLTRLDVLYCCAGEGEARCWCLCERIVLVHCEEPQWDGEADGKGQQKP